MSSESFKTRLIKQIPFLAIIVYALLLSALVFAEEDAEGASIQTVPDALWYSIVTLTTVGYGDYYPVTGMGKFLGIILVVGSLGLTGYLIGSFSSSINRYMEKKKMGLLGTSFKNHVVIIGWDDFGSQVTDQIVSSGNKVAIVTNNKNNIDLIRDFFGEEKVFAVFADYKNLEALLHANIEESSTVFINLNNDTETLIYILNLKKHYKELDIVVTLNSADLKETFHEAGVTYAVSKNEIASKLVASFIFEPDVAKLTEDIMSTAKTDEDYDIQEYHVGDKNPYLNQDCHSVFISIKNDYDCVFLGLSKKVNKEWKLIKNPSAEIKVEKGDYMIVMASGYAKYAIEKGFGVTEGKLIYS